MTRRILLFLALLTSFRSALTAQELVTGLRSNKVIANTAASKTAKGLKADTLSLPFFDDFSGRSIFPDPARWSDRNVFINNTYSDKQITKGMATFDAIDNRGALYETALSTGFKADQLTSNPINMAYPATDNIWFSFLFEAGGLSDSPESNDSLTLEFFAPSENKWHSVWRKTGSETRGFRNVILPITQSRYLRKGFRFRFVNYASTAQNSSDPSMVGNCDIWNVDYILLGRNRNAADTTFRDVAFTVPARSVLKNHEAMPWKQFRQVYLQEMGSAIKVRYRNNDTITRNVTRDFLITDVFTGQEAHSFTAGATNIGPLANAEYNAGLVYTFNSTNPDSALFRIRCTLKTDEFDRKQNDTAYYYQVFSNYFAFDDGSSEGGYGINGLGSRNAMVATRFTSYMPDTLRAIDISFNDSYLDANKRAFDLMVWDDNNGMPGNIIAKREEVIVEQGSVINGFFRYYIPGGVAIDGDFYVGWKQRSETFFNAGYDVNTSNKGRLKYWLNGAWNNSQVSGSLMIRPVTGDLIATGINDTKTDEIITKPENKVSLWPNPSSDIINIRVKEIPYSSGGWVSVIDLSGTEHLRVPLKDEIDISSLNEGLYIVITIINGRKVGINRLIKTK